MEIKPITIREFNQNYQRLHNQLEAINQYKLGCRETLDTRDIALTKLNALENIKKDISSIPEDSKILLAGYKGLDGTLRTFQQIEEFIAENKPN